MMKERPILFSAPMVRALLDGSKTQTRRVWKLPSWAEWDEQSGGEKKGLLIPKNQKLRGWYSVDEVACPHGAVGDQLWVRETFGLYGDKEQHVLHYRATHQRDGDGMRWKPSIHMPRWASRITLEIVGVSVERLCNISESDVIAEGCPSEILYGTGWYRDLWESINGAGSWDANPWVWVIEFNRIEQAD